MKDGMLYRSFPGKEEKLSVLGFGCMRLPLNGSKSTDIDIERATRMVRHAIDNGVNYVDTAWGYHGGESERFLAKALADGYRDKVYLATKLPGGEIKAHEDMDRVLNTQLQKLNTDHIDYYLIHGFNRARWDMERKLGLFDFITRALGDGRIRHIGFSFHDKLDVFKEIIDGYPWDFCQIQYNFLDQDYQAGREGLAYAYDRGVGIIVMEPLRGGAFTKTIPGDVQKIWDAAGAGRTPAERALRWVWNDPRVTVTLSGMSAMEHVEENLRVASQARAGSLPEDELRLLDQVAGIYRSRIKVDCTTCLYCMPCPHGVNIPSAFRFYNNASIFDNVEGPKEQYNRMFSKAGADLCVACGECEPKCPQQIPIIDELANVRELFYT